MRAHETAKNKASTARHFVLSSKLRVVFALDLTKEDWWTLFLPAREGGQML